MCCFVVGALGGGERRRGTCALPCAFWMRAAAAWAALTMADISCCGCCGAGMGGGGGRAPPATVGMT